MKRMTIALISSCFALFLFCFMQIPVNATDIWVSINAIIRMYRNDDIRMYKFHYLSDTICMR